MLWRTLSTRLTAEITTTGKVNWIRTTFATSYDAENQQAHILSGTLVAKKQHGCVSTTLSIYEPTLTDAKFWSREMASK